MLQSFDERNRDLIVNVGGRLTHRDDAKVSPFDSVVQGGDAVWEGLRLYNGRIFRLDEHTKRLMDSCKILELKLPYTKAQLNEATIETVRRSGLDEGIYIRPLVYIGDGPLGVFPGFEPPIEVAIMTWVWGAYPESRSYFPRMCIWRSGARNFRSQYIIEAVRSGWRR